MTNDPISKLKKSAFQISLSEREHAAHRERILAFMQEHPSRSRVASPWSYLLVGARYAFAALLVLGAGGTVFASTTARPGDALYAVRVRVAEPVQLALTFDTEEKTDLRVALAETRLKELAEASTDDAIGDDTVALIASSLEEQVDGVHEGVADLVSEGKGSDAYVTNHELQSVLETHADILEKIAAAEPERADEVAAVTAIIEGDIALAESAEPALREEVGKEPTDPTIQELRGEVFAALDELRTELDASTSTLDEADRVSAGTLFTSVEALVGGAEKSSGDEALTQYSEADSLLSELRTLLHAERTLNIDVVDAALAD